LGENNRKVIGGKNNLFKAHRDRIRIGGEAEATPPVEFEFLVFGRIKDLKTVKKGRQSLGRRDARLRIRKTCRHCPPLSRHVERPDPVLRQTADKTGPDPAALRMIEISRILVNIGISNGVPQISAYRFRHGLPPLR